MIDCHSRTFVRHTETDYYKQEDLSTQNRISLTILRRQLFDLSPHKKGTTKYPFHLSGSQAGVGYFVVPFHVFRLSPQNLLSILIHESITMEYSQNLLLAFHENRHPAKCAAGYLFVIYNLAKLFFQGSAA